MKRDIVHRPPVTITKQLLESTVGISLDSSLPVGSHTSPSAAYGDKLLTPTSADATNSQSTVTLKTLYFPTAIGDEEIRLAVDMNCVVPHIVLSANENYIQVACAFSTNKPVTVEYS
ncbi:hypothetical protein BOX07_gp44 [Pseudoalteromonas phage PH1]|uniref:hypothetical protein n=1 Tax=Pseudoalteromonas phage PH1 TaxID=1874540 RepID=UPI00081997AC|nr:hypothetical protein BOX07_gp44 [Pseudoalteromonas phage PH1]ANY29555.1 hypothetical protein [Pseudoalteromonas phage PH1]